ncbi:MAG: HD domain-containing protein [Patescibacteria group bacterium]
MVEQLWEEFHVPENVRQHCLEVARVCRFIGERIPGVDLDLLSKAALLHDLVRVCDFKDFETDDEDLKFLRKKYRGRGHEEAAAEILAGRGEKKLADLVKSHKFSNIAALKSWEEKILYYADKRVEGDRVVSLEERLDRGRERNAVTIEERRVSDEARPKVFELEKEVCREAGIELKNIK